MLLEILLQELRGFIVQLRRRAGALLRSQRLSPAGLVEVAFDRREAHAEGAGCLCLGHPASHGGDYPLSEVFRVAIHVVMLSSVHLYRNMLLHPAAGSKDGRLPASFARGCVLRVQEVRTATRHEG